jgi:hypothetical protein
MIFNAFPFADDANEDFFEGEAGGGIVGVGLGVDAGAKLFEGAVGDELAVVDDAYVGAEALNDFENVGGEEDSCAAGDHALQHLLEGAGGDGVDALEGLVEKEDLRPVDDGCGEGELFLHAVREVGDELLGFAGKVHEFEELFAALESGGVVQAVHLADEAQVFGGGEASEESHAFGNDADLALDFERVRGEIEAEDLNAARGGGEQAGQHLDGGGFAGAVGAEKAVELTLGDVEVDVPHGNEIAETAGKSSGGDGCAHGCNEDTRKGGDGQWRPRESTRMGDTEKAVAARPSVEDSRAAFQDLLVKIRFENTTPNDGYLKALGAAAK